MAQKSHFKKDQVREEQMLARAQHRELKDELTENFSRRPRLPRGRRKAIAFGVLGVIALLVILFTSLVLWPAAAQQPRGGIAVGMPAPAFTLPVLGGTGVGGRQVDLRALHGHPVVLNFWSENCQPCLSEMPYLRGIYAHYGVGGVFTLLGIDQADPRDDISTFGSTYGINYPLLYDAGSAINQSYGVTSLPMTYFIDSDGVVRFVVPQQLTPQLMQQGLAAVGVVIP